MRRRRYFLLFVTVLLFLVLPTASKAALNTQDISGKASTVFEWFDDGQGETALVLYQYLLINGSNLLDSGGGFRLYGRIGEDIKNTVDADSRLYYGYYEKKEVFTDLDMKLGRHFVTSSAGAAMVDGVSLKYKDLGPMTVSLFGGKDVKYYSGYNVQDIIWGAETQGRFLEDKNLEVGVSYIQKWNDGDLANELIGAEIDYEYKDLINLYSDVQYNYLNDTISYFLGGFNYYRSSRWSMRTEYLYSLPVFETTSIYSVFAVNAYKEAMTELLYKINDKGLRSFARYTREIYTDYSDADVVETGIEQIRYSRWGGYMSLLYRRDKDGQDMEGMKIHASYKFMNNLIAGIGAHVDVLERRLEDQSDETTSQRYWTDVTMPLMDKMELQGKVEAIKSDLYSEYYRGRIRLNIRF